MQSNENLGEIAIIKSITIRGEDFTVGDKIVWNEPDSTGKIQQITATICEFNYCFELNVLMVLVIDENCIEREKCTLTCKFKKVKNMW